MSTDRDTWASTTPIPSAEALGRAIGLRRRARQLSQKDLGEKVAILPSTISRIELEGDENIPFGAVVRLVEALELDLELRPRGSKFIPRPPTKVGELGLSPNAMSALRMEGLEHVDQLGSATSMLARPEFGGGAELYEIVCALNRHGLSLPPRFRAQRVPGEREREIFGLRIVNGLMLRELAQLHDLNRERIRQILRLFGLSGPPPAATQRRRELARRRARRV